MGLHLPPPFPISLKPLPLRTSARWSLCFYLRVMPRSKSLLKDSGVILPADWASSGKAKANARRERACALIWARFMLNEPETYLQLSAPLTSYLQGLYRIRAEHLQSSRWASSLSSIVSANMADKGDTPTKTSLADSQPVSKRATRAAAGTNLLGAFSAASDRQSAASQQQQATDSVSSSAATGAQLQPSSQSGAASASQFSSSGLQVINVDSHSLANQPLQRQQAVAAPVMFNVMSSAVQVNPFSSLPITQAQSHHSHAHAQLTAGGRGQTYWHSETQLLAVIPEEFKSFMYSVITSLPRNARHTTNM